jgi:hypothetical protein
MTVAEILRRHPAARPVLAGLGLDACCGGAHPLEFACRAHGVDLGRVIAGLEAVVRVEPEAGGDIRIEPSQSVREVIRLYPATVAVFDRHGLMGCGGAQGPAEPLGWFAQVHHVDLGQLVAELEEAARSGRIEPAPGTPTRPDPAEENLYRRFLKAALLFTFTGGTALGAWALGVMALRGELGGIARGWIQVHGHYQLFGWVGLFVVGIAYHILPRLTGVPLPSYRRASESFLLLAGGTILRTAQALDPSAFRSTTLIAGALMELAGCLIFLWTVRRILRGQAGGLKPYQTYLVLGTGWLVVSAVLNLLHAGHLSLRGAFEIPPYLNIPYLTVFLLGFVVFWILGVSLRTLPVFLELRTRPGRAAALALPLTASVAALAVGDGLLLAGAGGAWGRILLGAGGMGAALALAVYVHALGILIPPAGPGEPGIDRRYEKFLRLGYAWLLISAAMLGTFSVLALAGRDLDHAFVGAYRHAITVGFITTLMVGMAARIVPIFRGVPLYSPRLLDATFWLLAVGTGIRVVFQSLSGWFGPEYLRAAAVSGVMELAALILFGVNLWKTLDRPAGEEEPAGAGGEITPEERVGSLLAARPELLPVFLGAGFTALANPVLRNTVARGVSIGQACRMHGVDLETFLERLRRTERSGV